MRIGQVVLVALQGAALAVDHVCHVALSERCGLVNQCIAAYSQCRDVRLQRVACGEVYPVQCGVFLEDILIQCGECGRECGAVQTLEAVELVALEACDLGLRELTQVLDVLEVLEPAVHIVHAGKVVLRGNCLASEGAEEFVFFETACQFACVTSVFRIIGECCHQILAYIHLPYLAVSSFERVGKGVAVYVRFALAKEDEILQLAVVTESIVVDVGHVVADDQRLERSHVVASLVVELGGSAGQDDRFEVVAVPKHILRNLVVVLDAAVRPSQLKVVVVGTELCVVEVEILEVGGVDGVVPVRLASAKVADEGNVLAADGTAHLQVGQRAEVAAY